MIGLSKSWLLNPANQPNDLTKLNLLTQQRYILINVKAGRIGRSKWERETGPLFYLPFPSLTYLRGLSVYHSWGWYPTSWLPGLRSSLLLIPFQLRWPLWTVFMAYMASMVASQAASMAPSMASSMAYLACPASCPAFPAYLACPAPHFHILIALHSMLLLRSFYFEVYFVLDVVYFFPDSSNSDERGRGSNFLGETIREVGKRFIWDSPCRISLLHILGWWVCVVSPARCRISLLPPCCPHIIVGS